MAKAQDPTKPICLKASQYPDAIEGTSCNQTSFKVGKKAFLYIGMQGGKYKAMFKLSESMTEAVQLAKSEPESYQTGSTGWVTARFTTESPLPKAVWEKWLEESYQLTGNSSSKSSAARK
jgi:predicted DNA-binding protein (MmcQ/YjbR family)